jgi:hypothetical protein
MPVVVVEVGAIFMTYNYTAHTDVEFGRKSHRIEECILFVRSRSRSKYSGTEQAKEKFSTCKRLASFKTEPHLLAEVFSVFA